MRGDRIDATNFGRFLPASACAALISLGAIPVLAGAQIADTPVATPTLPAPSGTAKAVHAFANLGRRRGGENQRRRRPAALRAQSFGALRQPCPRSSCIPELGTEKRRAQIYARFSSAGNNALSKIAPLGWHSHPAACRTHPRLVSWICCQMPCQRHAQKYWGPR